MKVNTLSKQILCFILKHLLLAKAEGWLIGNRYESRQTTLVNFSNKARIFANQYVIVLWNLSEPYRQYIEYVVMPAAIEWMQMTYSVIPYTNPLKATQTTCNSKPVPAEVNTGVADIDLYIIVNWVNATSSSYVAKAGACTLDATTGR